MKVQLIAHTAFRTPPGVDWVADETAPTGQNLIEFAGRACYQSWKRPNPKTATNHDYIKHIIDVEHFSVLEHASATFYITEVSRSLTHELVRHRHLSFSQLSQRYVKEPDGVIMPPVIENDKELHAAFMEVAAGIKSAYEYFLTKLDDKLSAMEGTARKKAVRQAARSVLPNATATKLVVTGNYRAWREFLDKRATSHADVEIRALAVEIGHQLQHLAPSVFGDYQDTLCPDDGTVILSRGR